MKKSTISKLILTLILMLPVATQAAERLKLSSTTSTDNTGLLAYLLPIFEGKSGIRVDVIASLRTATPSTAGK
jgi:tungstate transport system substrate-binding protein